jgi:hypothetical protein
VAFLALQEEGEGHFEMVQGVTDDGVALREKTPALKHFQPFRRRRGDGRSVADGS